MRLPVNYCQQQFHSLGFDPAACSCCLGQALGMNSECWHKTSSCRTAVSCQLSSSNPPSTAQGQSSHLCKGSCRAAPAEGSIREAQLCWQTETKRTGRGENILRCQRFSTVPITDHSHMPGLKNDVNREIYTYLKSKDFINWSLLFCGTAVSLFRGLSNTAITATCMSLVQNSKINQIRIHMKFRGSFYYLPRILLMFSASFSWRDLLLKIFSLAFSITSCWKTQVVRFLFLTSLEKEHEWKIM